MELLKYVMSGTGPTCHCCMICDKQAALVTLPTHKDGIGRGLRGQGSLTPGPCRGTGPRNPGRERPWHLPCGHREMFGRRAKETATAGEDTAR